MKFEIDFARLKEFDRELYMRVSGFFNINDDLIYDLDLHLLKPETRTRVIKFLAPKSDQPDTFRIDPSDVDDRTNLVKAEADEAAGVARLEQYVREQGLLPVPENAAAVQTFVDKHFRGYWSGAGVDVAIANLRAVLKWKPKTQPQLSASVSPVKPIEVLSDGSSRLPVDAVPNRKHTKAQLQDLDKRLRAARAHDRHGWIGAAF
jgi:hypothetical protein